jgi:hypothetical protein
MDRETGLKNLSGRTREAGEAALQCAPPNRSLLATRAFAGRRITVLVPCAAVLLAVSVGTSAVPTAAPTTHAAEPAAVEAGFTSLFDGKTLAGWEGKAGMFRVVDGAIVAGTLKERIPNNEFLCSTQEYGDFELRLQAKLVGTGENAGIQFRSARIPNHHEVIGFQCDMGRMNGKPIWGWLYDESRRKKFLVESEPAPLSAVLKADGWNDIVIRCQGPRIELFVNGLKTCDYTEKEDNIARRGVIGLQIHSGPPAEASYRNIRIKKLD